MDEVQIGFIFDSYSSKKSAAWTGSGRPNATFTTEKWDHLVASPFCPFEETWRPTSSCDIEIDSARVVLLQPFIGGSFGISHGGGWGGAHEGKGPDLMNVLFGSSSDPKRVGDVNVRTRRNVSSLLQSCSRDVPSLKATVYNVIPRFFSPFAFKIS